MRKTIWWRISILFLALFLGSVYLLTMAPGLTWANRGADGGDLITATATGGVSHPSGYPTYLLIAKLFQFLPLGSLAFRTNLMSALFAVLTALLVADLVRRSYTGSILIGRIAGLLAGLGFGLSPLLWSQALITEVYTLHTFFVALILWLMSLTQETRFLSKTGFLGKDWLDRLGGLIFGLALGAQITVIFLLPVWLFMGVFGQGAEKQGSKNSLERSPRLPRSLALLFNWNILIRRAGWLLIGLSIYLTIPLRARSGAPVNWGNPTNWKGLWWLVSGSMYQDRVFRLGLEYIWPRTRTWAGMLQDQFGLPGLALGFYGLFYAQLKRKYFYAVTIWMMLAYSVFAIGYNSSDSYTLLLPAFLAFAFWFGLGCASVLAQIAERQWHAWVMPVGIGLILSLVFINAGMNYTSVDASDSHVAEAFVETVFAVAPERAILFTQADRDTFALWYYHFALEQRPDLIVIVQPHLCYDWYRSTLASVYPDLLLPDPETDLSSEAFRQINDRSVCRVELEAGDFLCPTCAQAKGSSDVLECLP